MEHVGTFILAPYSPYRIKSSLSVSLSLLWLVIVSAGKFQQRESSAFENHARIVSFVLFHRSSVPPLSLVHLPTSCISWEILYSLPLAQGEATWEVRESDAKSSVPSSAYWSADVANALIKALWHCWRSFDN